MDIPGKPANERERLAALHELLLVDTEPEQRFDTIVDYAAAEFGVPICLVTLVDEDRQWFKARVGLAVCSTPRDISFCGHAILQSDIFLIEDALLDPRFASNPLVTQDPWIRFYAGAPLVLPAGHAIGTLCIIDSRPRTLSATDLDVLSKLRDMVVAEIMGRAREQQGLNLPQT